MDSIYRIIVSANYDVNKKVDPKIDFFEWKLLFVLVNFLEVFVGINLELTAGSLVAGNNSVLVKLKCAYCPRVVYTALNTVAKCTRSGTRSGGKEVMRSSLPFCATVAQNSLACTPLSVRLQPTMSQSYPKSVRAALFSSP